MHESSQADTQSPKFNWTGLDNFVCKSYPHFNRRLLGKHRQRTRDQTITWQFYKRAKNQPLEKATFQGVPVVYCLKNHAVVSNTNFYSSGCCTNRTIPSMIYTAPKQVPSLPGQRQPRSPRQTVTALCRPSWVNYQLALLKSIYRSSLSRMYCRHVTIYCTRTHILRQSSMSSL